MLFSSFTGFAQLGLFTIVGLLVALAVTRWVLPAVLPERSPFRGATMFAIPLIALMRQARIARFAVLGLTLVAALTLVLHKGRYWEDELASMSPLPTAEKYFFAPLESSFCLQISLSVNWISYSRRAGRQPNFGCQNRAWQPNGSGISQAMTGLQNSAIEPSLVIIIMAHCRYRHARRRGKLCDKGVAASWREVGWEERTSFKARSG